MKNYKFTVFTPCYNGANTIERVFDSMNAQTYSNWEWIIINDGSTDDSEVVISKLISESQWRGQITYIKQENAGKHISWNRALGIATGDFFVPADCDDSFVPETLAFFNEKANELRGSEFCNSELSGISVCCYDPKTSNIIGTQYPEDGIVSNDIELVYKYHVRGEKWGCIRVDLLKERPFPEIKGHFYNENYLWFSFPRDGYLKANYNKKIRAYYFEQNSLTNNKTYRLDSKKAKMQMSFELWKIWNVGSIIFKYSPKDYFKSYIYLTIAFVKYGLSILNGK